MLPTAWLVPETTRPAVVLLLATFTRLAPADSAETEPANSSVAPLLTVAVAPAPTVAAPLVTLNRTLPAAIFSEAPAANVAGAVTCRVPAPPEALAPTLSPLAPETLRPLTARL